MKMFFMILLTILFAIDLFCSGSNYIKYNKLKRKYNEILFNVDEAKGPKESYIIKHETRELLRTEMQHKFNSAIWNLCWAFIAALALIYWIL